jgi:SMODS and SLOG-associating 2TM effector domain 2
MANQMQLEPAVLSKSQPPPSGIPALVDEAAAGALAKAADVLRWYRLSIPKKRVGAIFTRLGAILLGSMATVVPTILGIFGDATFLQKWVPIGGVLAVVAALLILIDRFAGYSTGWMRYITAHQEVSAKLEDFQFAWTKERLKWTGGATVPRSAEQMAAMLDLVAAFVASINSVVKQETQAWMVEFKGALAELEKTASETRTQALAAAAQGARGAIEVVIVGVARLDRLTWNLQLGETSSPVPYVGTSTAAVVDLAPGPVKLRVAGSIDAKPWSVEKAAQIEAGKTTQVQVTPEAVN